MILTRHLLHQRVCKFLIHGVVVLPVRSPKRRAGMCDVAEGPETLVGETVVISVFLLGAEPDATQRVARIIRWNLQPIMTVHCFYIRIAATMGHPRSVAGAKNRLKRCNQTAAWPCDPNRAAAPVLDVGFTVWNHEKAGCH